MEIDSRAATEAAITAMSAAASTTVGNGDGPTAPPLVDADMVQALQDGTTAQRATGCTRMGNGVGTVVTAFNAIASNIPRVQGSHSRRCAEEEPGQRPRPPELHRNHRPAKIRQPASAAEGVRNLAISKKAAAPISRY